MGEKSRMVDSSNHNILKKGLRGLQIDESKANKLLEFLTLLKKWNNTYNLTAIRSLEDMVVLHALDSASVYSHLQGNSIIDVGTGGGIPGMIFALLNPELEITLLDSNQKKTRFLRYASRQMNLTNVEVVCQRVEKFQAKKTFDVVISRAFSEVQLFLRLAGHLCSNQGLMLAMKGPRKESEENVQDLGFIMIEGIEIEVPYLDAKRRLLKFKKA